MKAVVLPSLSISLRGRVRLIRPFVEDNVMIRKHTYMIVKAGAKVGANGKPIAVPMELQAEYPDSIAAFGPEERTVEIYSGFISAHHVQSAVKAAFAAEKPSEAQVTLMAKVIAGEVLEGVSFIPDKRSAQRKDDSTVLAMRAAWEVLSVDEAKLGKLAERFNIEEMPSSIEELVAGYWAFVDAEKARVAKEASALLDL